MVLTRNQKRLAVTIVVFSVLCSGTMAWTVYQKGVAVLMVVTGSLNTLSTKWADRQCAVGQNPDTFKNGKGCQGSDFPDGSHKFDHPFLQAAGMFLGEFSCLWVFHIARLIQQWRNRPYEVGNQNFNPFIFLPAAMCDMCGTSLMYIGLNLTFASSFQMLRGAVIIFTALLSVAFLGRTIKPVMWVGMVTVIVGLALVGLSDIVFGDNDTHDINGVIAGDLLIIMAQIIVAVQMVYEERFISRYNVPAMQAVGWEGLFGFTVLGILLVPFYFIRVGAFSDNPGNRLENALDGFKQLGNNNIIMLATFGNIISIAFFNFSGISVTKEISATTRMVLDSVRTLVIWGVTLIVRWQNFQWLQIIGFLMLLTGMCFYNEIIIMPLVRYIQGRGQVEMQEPEPVEEERRPLINDGTGNIQGGPGYMQNAAEP